MIEIQQEIIKGLGSFFVLATVLMPLMSLMWSLIRAFFNFSRRA